MKQAIAAIFAITFIAGCSSELETGYKPKPLGVTPEERRAYYAPQFSPESQAAGQGKDTAPVPKRPNY